MIDHACVVVVHSDESHIGVLDLSGEADAGNLVVDGFGVHDARRVLHHERHRH